MLILVIKVGVGARLENILVVLFYWYQIQILKIDRVHIPEFEVKGSNLPLLLLIHILILIDIGQLTHGIVQADGSSIQVSTQSLHNPQVSNSPCLLVFKLLLRLLGIVSFERLYIISCEVLAYLLELQIRIVRICVFTVQQLFLGAVIQTGI